MQIIGQKNLLEDIDVLIEDKNFPKSTLIVGEIGSGRHTIAKHIAELLHIEYTDITDTVCLDDIIDITLSSSQRLVVIDISSIDERKCNTILKFVEEPPEHDYILLIADEHQTILPTLNNRCVRFYMENYTHNELSLFLPAECSTADFVLKYANTPGDVIKYSSISKSEIDDLTNLVDMVVTKINIAPMYNIFNIKNKICLSKNSTGHDVNLFFNLLIDRYVSDFSSGKLSDFTQIQTCINYLSAMKNSAYNKEYMFDSFLLALKRTYIK